MLPIIVETTFLTIYSYPLLMGMASALAYEVALSLCTKEKRVQQGAHKFLLLQFLLAWIFAKLFFYLFSLHGTVSYLSSSSFWLGGGFVFYGGLIGGLLAMFLAIKLKWVNLIEVARMSPALPLAHAVGRVGCLLAGCCYGIKTQNFLGVGVEHRLPVPLFEALGLLGLFFIMLRIKKPMKRLFCYLLIYPVLRFLLEFLRGDEVRGFFLASLSTSQVISLFLFVITLIIFVLHRRSLHEI